MGCHENLAEQRSCPVLLRLISDVEYYFAKKAVMYEEGGTSDQVDNHLERLRSVFELEGMLEPWEPGVKERVDKYIDDVREDLEAEKEIIETFKPDIPHFAFIFSLCERGPTVAASGNDVTLYCESQAIHPDDYLSTAFTAPRAETE